MQERPDTASGSTATKPPIRDDKSVRDQIRKKDYDVIKETYKDLAREEEELKGFFKDLKAPTKEDPTVVRTSP